MRRRSGLNLLVSLLVSASCAACDSGSKATGNNSIGTATLVNPTNVSPSESRPDASNTHEYASREGEVFYYKGDDGALIGVRDLGRLPADQDFSRVLRRGDRAVQLDGGVFAAVSPNSDVVRVARHLPNEQILRPVANVPLSDDSVPAKALRDSLAGRLTFPSEKQLGPQSAPAPAVPSNVEEAGNATAVPDDAISNARPDDYKE